MSQPLTEAARRPLNIALAVGIADALLLAPRGPLGTIVGDLILRRRLPGRDGAPV